MTDPQRTGKARRAAEREARFWAWAAVAAFFYLAVSAAFKCWGLE